MCFLFVDELIFLFYLKCYWVFLFDYGYKIYLCGMLGFVIFIFEGVV